MPPPLGFLELILDGRIVVICVAGLGGVTSCTDVKTVLSFFPPDFCSVKNAEMSALRTVLDGRIVVICVAGD